MTTEHAPHLCVATVPIFKHLPEAMLTRIGGVVQHTHFEKGASLYLTGSPADALYIIHEGQVKVSRGLADGREQIVRLLEPGDFDGDHGLFVAEQHTASATATAPVSACVLYKREFQHLLADAPDVSFAVMQELTRRIDTLEAKTTAAMAPVEARLADYLLEQKQPEFRLPMKKKDLAQYLGTTPETLSRRLKTFTKAGLIEEVRPGVIRVLDASGLAAQSALQEPLA
ncbi:Crp/Fnr family transcriptional regulator [Lacticaseibacillus kribbianus]|uniref:Crp/Fnr family transcriptional regulator n=1 Tax=Lacticaseibacillus kribbianus TaxID=2926292 RepID=UPI001CD635E6|nr:Crp/Fnr family transcriptional regulator [Lacticaseibacillus kribbianus]